MTVANTVLVAAQDAARQRASLTAVAVAVKVVCFFT